MTTTEHRQHSDHDSEMDGSHAHHRAETFRDLLWFSLVLTVPILYFSPQIQSWLGYEAARFSGDAWVSPVLATVLYVYAGRVFLNGARRELADRSPGMMTLVALAISVAYGYSLAVSIGLDGTPFYWELATLLDVMLLGHWLEMRSVSAASRALEHLAALVPDMAHRVEADGELEEVPVDQLEVNDRILVRPGEQVPVDGVIEEGASSMNESFLTGESRPVRKGEGDEVVAGSVNGEGSITIVVTRTGDDTSLSQILRLVEEAQRSRSRFQALADRAALWLTIVAIGVAIPTLVAWLVFGGRGVTFAMARTVTVLVIACPHALGLAIPLVITSGTSLAARHGILVRNREAFERGRKVSLVAFDKTGTLTEGRFEVRSVVANGNHDESLALQWAAALERGSEHPLGAAIVAEARSRDLAVPDARRVETVAGTGITGEVDGQTIRVGRPSWIDELGATVPETLREALDAADERGASAVVVMVEKDPVGVISLADRVRPSAATALARLRDMDIEPVMITGDAEAVARTVADELGIDRYHARVRPGDKASLVKEMRDEDLVAFVGDGINDAPALLEADLGIAIGAGTNVAIESADLVLIDDDPADVAAAIELSRATGRKMYQNLAWATGYNVVALPLAAGVAVSAGIVLEPAIGGLFMSASTIIVAINALLLRRMSLSANEDSDVEA